MAAVQARAVQALALAALPALLGWPGAQAGSDAATGVPPERMRQLVHVVRQDCGACHGMQLKGGLGPALTPEALAGKPAAALAAVIVHGRPGTPMPPWRSMLTEADAQWIAEQLLAGFPQEARP